MSTEKVCVFGSGPAGTTAAYFLWRAEFYVTALDSEQPGSELILIDFDPMTHQRRPQDG